MANVINKIKKDGVEYDIQDPNAATQADLTAAENDIDAIEAMIPAQASSLNQLADKGFVNSSIQTQTAHFRGNWENWTAVPTSAADYPVDDDGNHEPTSNDYMVVQDASGFPVGEGEPALEGTWRFKYSGTWTTNGKNGWLSEYQVNETPLTAAQLAALNSGITDTAVTKLNGIEAGAEANDIDSISVNGTAVTPDANKNVDLTIDPGVRTLTTDDYGYPVENPDGVPLWLLEPGIYKLPYGVKVYYNTATSDFYNIIAGEGVIITITRKANLVIIETGSYNYRPATFKTSIANGTGSAFGTPVLGSNVIYGADIVDNLTSTTGTQPLSANQGKTLNDKIEGRIIQNAGAPTASTVGTVGMLLEDTTNGKLYQCTAVTSEGGSTTYTWEKQGGSGGLSTLTTEDYNFPTTGTKTRIVLGYLEPGVYKVKKDDNGVLPVISLRDSTSDLGYREGDVIVVLRPRTTGTNYRVIMDVYRQSSTEYGGTLYYTNGSTSQTLSLLGTQSVIDNLTSNIAYYPLSAKQGKVLNDKISELEARVAALEGN